MTQPRGAHIADLPAGLSLWLARTQRSAIRIAFVLGQEWWAYDFADLGAAPDGAPHASTFFVIASSDRHDPEWGADHAWSDAADWAVGNAVSERTRSRLISPGTKA